MRRLLLVAILASLLLGRVAAAQDRFPGAAWDHLPPAQSGWSEALLADVRAWSEQIHSTAFMVVHRGVVVAEWGDTTKRTELASVRKSLLSALIGIAVAERKISLDSTLAQLGIDDNAPALTDAEKQATVRMLLEARSGIYHPALYETPGMAKQRPARGSHEPGTFWYYNNWDFNVLGAVFERLTGKTVFQALDQDLARPLQMQDFQLSRQRMMGFENQSRFLAYHLFLSARDMARLGLAMARGGDWNGRQVVPAAWVRESTEPHVAASSVGRGGELAYGYLWWIPATRKTAPWSGSFMASGQFGQFILVLPAIDTVIVHRRAVTDEYAVARNLGKTKFEPPRVLGPDFLKLADMVVAARS